MLILEIITPTGVVFTAENVQSVKLPTTTGELGILPGHIPLTSQLQAGEVEVVLENGNIEELAVDVGYVRILSDRVSILTEAAIDVKKIDLSAVEEAQKRAEMALEAARNEKAIDPVELEKLEAIARFAIAQKLIKKGQ